MAREEYFLETKRLGMRRYCMADLEALRAVFADGYAARFYPLMRQQEGLERWINWNLENYADFGFGLWALELLEDGVFIGDAGITWQSVEGERVLEIGWHVHPSFRSMGYATEAGRACLEFAFRKLQAPAIGSIVDSSNTASMKVASRVHAGHREYQGSSGRMLFFSTTSAQFTCNNESPK